MFGKEKFIAFNVVIIAFFLSFTAAAQLKCKIEYFSTENGLSHDAVTHLIKDREGFMWFSTWNGINRFDGRNFISYKSSPGDSSELKHDRIDVVAEDGFNHLWLRGSDRNIYRFDKGTEQFLNVSTILQKEEKSRVEFGKILVLKDGTVLLISLESGLFHITSGTRFTAFKKGLSGEHSIPSNVINFVYEDLNHNIWVGTSNGLGLLVRSAGGGYKSVSSVLSTSKRLSYTAVNEDKDYLYIGTEKGLLAFYNKTLRQFSYLEISSGRIKAICPSRKRNKLYVSTTRGELITVDLQTNKHSKMVLALTSLSSIYEDRMGYLWVEPEKFGVIRVSPYNNTFEMLYQAADKQSVASTRFKVFEDIYGTVWVNMKGGGFGFYDPVSHRIEYFYNEPNATNRQFSNVVHDLFYDKAGVLWLITDDRGIHKVFFQPNNFNRQLLTEHAKFKAHNEVRGLLSDSKNRLWVGAKSGKLTIYHKDRLLADVLINDPPAGLGPIYTMLEDRKGNIWLGTKGNGLWKAVPVDEHAAKYRLTQYLTSNSNLNGNQIYALLEDKKGRIWVGTFDNGFNVALDSGNGTEFINKGTTLKDYPGSFKKIRNLEFDVHGNIWVATTDGLLVLDAENDEEYKVYNKIPGDKSSIGNNDVQIIFKDSKGKMWLGTSGGGIALAIGDNPLKALAFRNYTMKEGLPNDFILSCVEDMEGNLWLATQNGLSKFNIAKNSFRNFDSYDGLPKTAFSEASSVRLANGTLVFGTTKGFISFDPEHILNQKVPANIVFTNLRVNNQDILPDSEDGIIKKNINYVSEIVLEHNQNIFSIDYATLDHRFSNKQAYAYRLKGFDDAWQNNKGLLRITYTNLPPGEYLLEVKSLDNELNSNVQTKSLSITILPPPWRTWWAYLLYFIILSILFLVVRRTALTMLHLRNKITVEQKLAELKVSFFTNISHELRTPLTLILNPIEEISRSENLSVQGASYIEIVRKNANRMVRFINQLLDLRKVQSGKANLDLSTVEIVSFVKSICEYFTETARQKQIALELHSFEKELFTPVDAEKLDIVIYNILANAFKFTPEGKKIRVAINQGVSDDVFVISVHDQGPGVEDDKLQDIFELYYEGATKEGKNFKGTGIGLALSKELVELHGGKISAVNNIDGGLTINVELKLFRVNTIKEERVFAGNLPNTLAERLELQLADPNTIEKDCEFPLVLLVEDNDDLRNFLKQQLSEQYRVELASNGEEGYAKAQKLLPDLVLSDVMMPKMDGIQMLDKLRNNLATSHIPVVLLTAKSSIESQIEGLRYGADYYITKPFNNFFLMASIDNLIKRRKRIFEGLLEKKETIKLAPGEIVITSRDETFLKEVIKIVENGMAEPDFNIDAVADTIGMGRTTFYKKFKSLTNLAPVEFVRDMRIQRGKQLLDAGEHNISTVAYSVGFNNPKYFGTCFKEKYGVTPSLYLKTVN